MTNNEQIVIEKERLRKHYLQIRRTLFNRKEKARAAETLFLDEIVRSQHESILLYSAFSSELDTSSLIQGLLQRSKQLYLPVTTDRNGTMTIGEIHADTVLRRGNFGISEPKQLMKPIPSLDLIVVPGIVFGRDGSRIGMGKGYYDRFFQQYPALYRVGYCFNEQLHTKALPCESHDYRMHAIVTPTEVIRCSGI